MAPVKAAGGAGNVDGTDISTVTNEWYYTCILCKPMYAAVTNTVTNNAKTYTFTTCSAGLNYLREYCTDYPAAAIGVNVPYGVNYKCNGCPLNSYSYPFTSSNVCLSTEFIKNQLAATYDASHAYCERFAANNCVQCMFPKGITVAAPSTCASCDTTTNSLKLGTLTKAADAFTYDPVRTCTAQVVASCAIEAPLFVDPASDGVHAYTCVECVKGTLPVVTIANEYVMYPYKPTNATISAPNSAFTPVSTCQAKFTGFRGTTDLNGNVYNCKYYYLLAASVFGCLRCNHGFNGVVLNDSPGVELGYINYCEPFTECDATVVYDGFKNPASNTEKIDSFFSCHKCRDANQIPVAFVTAGTVAETYTGILGLNTYAANNSPYTTFPIGGNPVYGRANECLSLSSLSAAKSLSPLGYGLTGTLVANCSMYFVNVFSSGDATTANTNAQVSTQISAWCAACSPGFTPTYSTAAGYTHFVITCTAITSCPTQAGVWVNSCSTGILMYEYKTGLINFSKVVDKAIASPSNKENCFAMDSLGNCRICKKDATLTRFGNCTREQVPYCSGSLLSTTFNLNNYLFYTYQSFYFYLYQQSNTGCTGCQTDYSLYEIPAGFTSDNSICMTFVEQPNAYSYNKTTPWDLNSQQGSLDTSGAALPLNCIRSFDYGASIKCRTCAVGFILISDFTCVSSSLVMSLTNCQIVSNVKNNLGQYTMCSTCANGYSSIGGLCYDLIQINPRIPANCATLDAASLTSPFAVCATCLPTFYLDLVNNLCVPISVSNCTTWDSVNNLCTACNPNFGLVTLSTSKVCIPLSFNPNGLDFDTNCTTVDETSLNSGILKCTTCKPGFYLDALNAASQHDFCQSFNGTLQQTGCMTYSIAATLATTSLGCSACDSVKFYTVPGLNVCRPRRLIAPGCTAYEANYDLCTTCNVQTLLARNQTACLNSIADKIGYLGACKPNPDCTLNEMQGLTTEVSSLLSCHTCKDPARIPFLFVSVRNDTSRTLTLRKFNIKPQNNSTFLPDGDSDSNVKCLLPTGSTFGLTTFNLPSNCAVGIVNLDVPLSAVDSNKPTPAPNSASIFCTACQPGFAPVPALGPTGKPIPNFISACNQIANCDFSNSFNSCTLCAKGYTFAFSPERGVQYDLCVSVGNNPNCFALQSTPLGPKCRYCKEGFYLNLDNICEIINPPKCQMNSFTFKEYYELNSLGLGLNKRHWDSGCTTCKPGFTGVKRTSTEFVCTESATHSTNTLPPLTRYIPNCQNYRVTISGGIACASCYNGYTLDVNNKCVLSSVMVNCTLFTGTKCSRCDQFSAMTHRVCNTPVISKCISYSSKSTEYEQVCTRCAPGYFLDANTCVQSTVKNCKWHANDKMCNECLPGFLPTLVRNQTNYCLPIDPALNCAQYSLSDLQSRQLTCQKCVNSTFVISNSKTDYYNTYCMQFTEISDCQSYETTISLAATGFSCLACNSGSFLNKNQCTGRTIQFLNCLRYSNTSDTCVACNAGFYLNKNGTSCVSYPIGIVGCLFYLSQTICGKCEPGYFLAYGKCQGISLTQQVANCEVHHQPGYCKKCLSGFIAVAGECRVVYATGCLRVASPFSCETCPEGMGLVPKGDLVICTNKPDPNCIVSTNTFPFNCTQCAPGYYLNNYVCTQIVTPIPNCQLYSSATLCAQCASGFALSTNFTSCFYSSNLLEAIDSNCLSTKIYSTPTCSTCKPGFYFSDTLCISCPQNGYYKNCYTCDPENPNKCLMCAPGFFMDALGNCIIVRN